MTAEPELLKHKETVLRREHGRITLSIECPFCLHKTIAYAWSLAGTGKLCSYCGAKHLHGGMTRYMK